MKRRIWTVADLETIPEDRQLSLLTYAEMFNATYRHGIRTLVRSGLSKDGTDRDIATIFRHAVADATTAVLKEGQPSWATLRRLVYERDGGICAVCGGHVPMRYYDLGHLQDRVMGGSDHPANLVVMCNSCNRLEKPLHETRDLAIGWCRAMRAAQERRPKRPAPDWDSVSAEWMQFSPAEQEAMLRMTFELPAELDRMVRAQATG